MIRLVKEEELNEVMEIISDAKSLLKITSKQWQDGYPYEDTMKNDIQQRNCFGYFTEYNKLIGIMTLTNGIDENYTSIDGEWIMPLSENDLTIHRLAVRKEYYHQGISKQLLDFSIWFAKQNRCPTIRIDTHKENIPMIKIMDSLKFHFSGIIKIKREKWNNDRNAYEYVIQNV